MSKWNQYRVGDICSAIYSGGTPSTSNEEYWDGDFYWLSSGETANRYISKTDKTITQKGVDNSSTKLAKSGTLVMACAGQGKTRGQASILKCDTYINQSIIAMVGKHELLDTTFLFYNMLLRYDELRMRSDASSTRGSITTDMLKKLPISVPDLPTQKRIADILSTYDDLIENNNRRIALLEKSAQELYKEWFVRFRFPGYENAKLENGLPEGWERTTFEKIASFQNGYAFKSNELLDSAEPNTYEVFKQGHIKRGGGFKAEGTKSWYHKSLCTGLQKFVLHKKDVLMAMTDMKDNVAILGNTAIMPYDNRYILNQRVGLLRPTHYRGTDFAYIHLLTNSYDFVQDLRSRANRGVQVNLSAVQIRESETVVPSEIINKKFAKIMDPIFEEIFNIMIQSENLAKQRDLLLPRLMSGKLEV